MPIVAMKDMLQHAHDNGYAVATFEIGSLEILTGIIMAAEQNQSPVILAVTESQLNRPGIDLLMPAIEAAAQCAKVPVAIQCHYLTNLDTAVQAINIGCNALMIDTDNLGIDSNFLLASEITRMAVACGIAVESGLNDELKVENTIKYIGKTDVDFFKITSDTVYGRRTHDPKLDYSVLSELRKSLKVPMVINSSNGMTEEHCYKLITHGISKVNFGPVLMDAVDTRIRINAEETRAGYPELMHGIHAIISSEVEACIQMCQSGGQADKLLEHCTPWAPVEHVIIFNVHGINDEQADAMMAEGRQSLSSIPGVRKVITAKAVKEDAQYRFSWLIRFCHPAVIDSYRDHPLHIAFADELFRPVAGDRISIDYQWNDAQ